MAEFLCCLPETTTTLLIGCVCVSHSVMFNSLRPYRLWPARLLCPWDSPGKTTGVGCHAIQHKIKFKSYKTKTKKQANKLKRFHEKNDIILLFCSSF